MIKIKKLLTDVTATGAGEKLTPLGKCRSLQAYGDVSATTGAATIDIEVSNDNVVYTAVTTLSLTLGVAVTSAIYTMENVFKYVRGNVKTISGTDAKVSLVLSHE